MVTDMDNSDDLGQRSALTSLYVAAMAVAFLMADCLVAFRLVR
jgi:hypothetical protein